MIELLPSLPPRGFVMMMVMVVVVMLQMMAIVIIMVLAVMVVMGGFPSSRYCIAINIAIAIHSLISSLRRAAVRPSSLTVDTPAPASVYININIPRISLPHALIGQSNLRNRGEYSGNRRPRGMESWMLRAREGAGL